MTERQPNIILIGIDSLLADHMSCYGYHRQTTPHIDRFSRECTLFEKTYSAHIPTTSAYASMLTGLDCFGTQIVALRNKGPIRDEVKMLPEILRDAGYDTSCVGFSGNISSRGFDQYFDYKAWGAWEEHPLTKADNLNEVALPELERLAAQDKPFFLFLRHMDPHSPYLPPAPFDRMFYHGDEFDPDNHSMDPVFDFAPFADFFRSWMPPGVRDKDYIIAQYDGAVAYLDASLHVIFEAIEGLGILDDTIIVLNGDHGETLYDHDCWFDHHGLYDVTLHVPLMIRYPSKVPMGKRVTGYNQHKDLVPTLMELAEIDSGIDFDGESLTPMIRGEVVSHDGEFYITECTWMRKHGWRTPQWKLIRALEPDFHFKPPVELYNLIEDPHEDHNLAEAEPGVVALLTERMEAWIARREAETGMTNPMYTQGDAWHGKDFQGPFKNSQEAYDTMNISSVRQADRLQAAKEEKENKDATTP